MSSIISLPTLFQTNTDTENTDTSFLFCSIFAPNFFNLTFIFKLSNKTQTRPYSTRVPYRPSHHPKCTHSSHFPSRRVALYLKMWGEYVGSPQNSIVGIDLLVWGPNILGSRDVGIELTCYRGDWKPPEIPCTLWEENLDSEYTVRSG